MFIVLWVHRYAAATDIHHRHLLYSAQKLITHFTVPQTVERWHDLGTAVRFLPTAVYRSGWHDKHTVHGEMWTWFLSHCSYAMLPLDHYDLQWTDHCKRRVNELWSGWDEQSCQFLVCNCFPRCMFRTVYDTESACSNFLHPRQLTVPYLRHVQLQRQTVTQLNSSCLIPVS